MHFAFFNAAHMSSFVCVECLASDPTIFGADQQLKGLIFPSPVALHGVVILNEQLPLSGGEYFQDGLILPTAGAKRPYQALPLR